MNKPLVPQQNNISEFRTYLNSKRKNLRKKSVDEDQKEGGNPDEDFDDAIVANQKMISINETATLQIKEEDVASESRFNQGKEKIGI